MPVAGLAGLVHVVTRCQLLASKQAVWCHFLCIKQCYYYKQQPNVAKYLLLHNNIKNNMIGNNITINVTEKSNSIQKSKLLPNINLILLLFICSLVYLI